MTYHWGRRRAAESMRMRDWLDAGLAVGGGSDWSLAPANPLWMIYFWVSRDTCLWGVLGPEQKITREEALADLVVLSDDILTVPEEKIRDIKALATFLGGKIVYQSENSLIRFP